MRGSQMAKDKGVAITSKEKANTTAVTLTVTTTRGVISGDLRGINHIIEENGTTTSKGGVSSTKAKAKARDSKEKGKERNEQERGNDRTEKGKGKNFNYYGTYAFVFNYASFSQDYDDGSEW